VFNKSLEIFVITFLHLVGMMRHAITIFPEERRTRHHPGCDMSFEIGAVTDCETGREMSSRWWDEHEAEVHQMIEEG